MRGKIQAKEWRFDCGCYAKRDDVGTTLISCANHRSVLGVVKQLPFGERIRFWAWYAQDKLGKP